MTRLPGMRACGKLTVNKQGCFIRGGLSKLFSRLLFICAGPKRRVSDSNLTNESFIKHVSGLKKWHVVFLSKGSWQNLENFDFCSIVWASSYLFYYLLIRVFIKVHKQPQVFNYYKMLLPASLFSYIRNLALPFFYFVLIRLVSFNHISSQS